MWLPEGWWIITEKSTDGTRFTAGAKGLPEEEKENDMKTIGSIVTMSENALDNYGEEYKNKELIITHTATKYMPSKEFYSKGQPKGYHPGYDESAGCALYDLKVKETGEALNFSLYEWELK